MPFLTTMTIETAWRAGVTDETIRPEDDAAIRECLLDYYEGWFDSDAARMDHGDADLAAFQFVPKRIGEAAHRELAGGIGGLARRGHDAVDARQVDDARLVGLAQQRQEGARQAHHGMEVDLHEPVEIVLGHLLEAAAQGHAGVVDQQVDAAVDHADGGGQGAHRGAVGDVDLVQAGAHAQCARFPGGGIGRGGVDVAQGQVAGAARQRQRDGAADAAAGAGDHGHAVPELHGSAPCGPKRITPSSMRP